MNIDDINILLDKVTSEAGDTVYCRASVNYYGKKKVIQLDGHFTPKQIREIYDISKMFAEI